MDFKPQPRRRRLLAGLVDALDWVLWQMRHALAVALRRPWPPRWTAGQTTVVASPVRAVAVAGWSRLRDGAAIRAAASRRARMRASLVIRRHLLEPVAIVRLASRRALALAALGIAALAVVVIALGPGDRRPEGTPAATAASDPPRAPQRTAGVEPRHARGNPTRHGLSHHARRQAASNHDRSGERLHRRAGSTNRRGGGTGRRSDRRRGATPTHPSSGTSRGWSGGTRTTAPPHHAPGRHVQVHHPAPVHHPTPAAPAAPAAPPVPAEPVPAPSGGATGSDEDAGSHPGRGHGHGNGNGRGHDQGDD
jgi:hypothetical protein